jgi:pSer/pThr/pTyr-binding forkhead associated (FHA) protein
MLKLIIEDDQNQVKVVRLLRDDITIGRKEGNTIRLTERNVSRNHARLTKKDDGDIIIEDLNSYNGVKVSSKKITKPTKIEEGDPVLIGDYKILLKVEDKKNKPDPFEEMATIPVDRVEEEELESAQQSVQNKPDVPDVPEKTSEKPTEPINNQTDEAKIIPKDKQGAFVVLTSSYSGSRYNFTKTPYILGRNPETDIFIDNQSLSSLHAEVSFDSTTYTLKDLGSKNGIRINGEKYEKMTLRKGDIVDLGHVRFRFVAPGEHYQFSKQESSEFENKSNTKLIVISIILVAFFGVGAFYIANNFFGKSKSPKDSNKTAKNKTAKTDSDDFQKLDKELSTLQKAKKWKLCFL